MPRLVKVASKDVPDGSQTGTIGRSTDGPMDSWTPVDHRPDTRGTPSHTGQ